jgi:DnaJ-class molecular chaperone
MIESEGMPILESNKLEREQMNKGNLFIHFDIKFPRNLTEDQRKRIDIILNKE